MLDTVAIKNLIPHRFPFLLVDRIVECETGKYAVGIKNITANDFYHCEFTQGNHMFSGALQVEAMAQVAAFVVMDLIEDKTRIPLFASIDRARFRKQAIPGDQLRMEVVLKKFVKGRIGKFEAKSYIDGVLASEASITCMITGGE